MLLDIAQSRPREQGFDALRTSAGVGAGSAHLKEKLQTLKKLAVQS